MTNDFILEPFDNQKLANLCGQFDEHLRQLERRFNVKINNRGHQFRVVGMDDAVKNVTEVLNQLYTANEPLSPERVHLYSQPASLEDALMPAPLDDPEGAEVIIRTRRGMVRGRGINQRNYLNRIFRHDINFGVGPAGTGKTYLAVACAVEALEREQIRRILLVRPAVEAGERLGFLPGDLAQKVDPYLRPLYDALYEMLGFERVTKFIERSVIEIAPLAYMRGRTLNDSFIILDEAQNTTLEQMKMFLTRIGFGSTAVITGDVTQIDLPNEKQSGLKHVIKILQEVEGISFTFFDSKDVVRHPIVARIIDAYDRAEKMLVK
ncbi:AAA family ATPase [Beggiatoa leptomitoformis]|uniref:PhoH-like protein n=2 Tax=Beggiatoa leptomitoformis TaxID=288004 RepID=A0A2N9YDD7_9GAMM|nr:PhoH family protein [Beggiatoa leptomitoformis]ALG69087.1 AAA family ATPase [Beggiatoa leptomitoformis]AUI68500.1 AAA family ATPase [Beggiatoa leptomitoformis]